MPDLDPSDPNAGFHVSDSEPIELTAAQAFDLERHSRLLDELNDPTTLRNMAKLLLRSWYAQKAATAWVVRQGLRR